MRGTAVGALLYSGIGDAHNNRVNVVDESRVEGSVYGAFMNNKSTGDAYINSIIIKNSSVEGGYVFCAVINGSTGNAYNNEVTVDHATVTNGQQKMGTVTGAVLEGRVNFHSKCKILGGVAEFFSKAFLCRFPPENFPRPVVYPVHSLPV